MKQLNSNDTDKIDGNLTSSMSECHFNNFNDSHEWYCVFTKPHEEKLASMNLIRQDMEIFLPYVRSKRLYRRKLQWITSPMFPRYLFVNIHDMEYLPQIRSTRGVSSLVTFGINIPAKVSVEIIDEIRSRCENDILILDEPEFKQGDKVEVIAGPYLGLKAIFDRHTTSEERVVILLEIMSVLAQVEVSRENLIKDEE